MGKMPVLNEVNSAIVSEFQDINSGTEVELYSGDMAFLGQDKFHFGVGRIYFNWEPSPDFYFHFIPSDGPINFNPINGSKFQITTDKFEPLKVLVTNFKYPSGETRGIVDTLNDNSSVKVKNLKFHVSNYQEFRGNHVAIKGTNNMVSRSTREIGKWKVELESFPKSKEEVSSSKSKNSYLITNIGKLSRKDGHRFSTNEGEKFLDNLKWVMSLIKGANVSPVFVTGHDENDNTIWMSFRPSWHSRFNEGEPLICKSEIDPTLEMLENFTKKIKTKHWERDLPVVISWYLQTVAPRQYVETQIVLSQVGLEMISWVFFVDEYEMLSRNGFKELAASDKISMLLHELNVPKIVPVNFGGLEKKREELGKADGPQIFTYFRNGIVHPSKKEEIYGSENTAKIQAARLGAYYLQMALLYVLGYNGTHQSACRFSNTEIMTSRPAPWLQK
jgi:hypothetical protein